MKEVILEKWKNHLPLALGVALAATLGYGSTIGHAKVETAIGSDVTANELRALTIESWDTDYSRGGYGWEVITNEDNTPRGAKYEFLAASQKAEREVKLIKGTPRDIKENQNYDKAKILAVRFSFSFPGYNVVSIRPPTKDVNDQIVDHYTIERPRPYLNEIAFSGEYRARSCFQNPENSFSRLSNRPVVVDCVTGIEIPGVVKQVSVWVMGRGNEYTLEGWFEDWKGDSHILQFGSVDFVGWRPLTAKIPTTVPQDVDSYPQIKTVVFKQFKLRAKPETSLEPVYIFFDELRVLTDIFEVHFDGAAIDFDKPDCNRKNRLFDIIRKNARFPDHWPVLADCSVAPGPAAPLNE
ncbi:MAG: endoflagellar filament sheath protein [Spirochaetales bacterium]|nr:endoflagellar filament sheath protein [Spirochaetales bacterium]